MGEKADVLLRAVARPKIAHRDGAMRFAGEIDLAHDELDWISRSVAREEIAFEGAIGGIKKPEARAFIREKLANLRADEFACSQADERREAVVHGDDGLAVANQEAFHCGVGQPAHALVLALADGRAVPWRRRRARER